MFTILLLAVTILSVTALVVAYNKTLKVQTVRHEAAMVNMRQDATARLFRR